MAAGVKIITGLMILFVVLTILSTMMETGTYLMTDKQGDSITWLTSFNMIGEDWLAIPKVALKFFTVGIPAMIAWDYAWLHDSVWGEMIRLILRAGTGIVIVWSIIVWVIPAMAHAVTSVAGMFGGGGFRP